MRFGTETNCTVCGTKIQQPKTGRTKEYCSDACRDFNKFLSASETALLKITNINEENIKQIRSKLWSMANITNGKKNTSQQ